MTCWTSFPWTSNPNACKSSRTRSLGRIKKFRFLVACQILRNCRLLTIRYGDCSRPESFFQFCDVSKCLELRASVFKVEFGSSNWTGTRFIYHFPIFHFHCSRFFATCSACNVALRGVEFDSISLLWLDNMSVRFVLVKSQDHHASLP